MRLRATKTEPRNWRELSAHLFRERQILLRSEDRVRCLTLRPRVQKAAVLSIAAGCLWLTVSSAGLWLQQERLGERERQLAQSRADYEGLVARIETVGLQADRLAVDLVDGDGQAAAKTAMEASGLPKALDRLRGDLTSLAAENSRLARQIDQTRADWKAAQERSAELVEERTRLRGQLSTTTAALEDAKQRRKDIRAELDKVAIDLRAARDARQAEASGRLNAQSRADGLQEALAALQANERRLEGDRQALEARLAESKAGEAELRRERHSLSHRLGSLEKTLGLQQGEPQADEPQTGGDLTGRIAALHELLLAAEGRSDRLALERRRQEKHIQELEQKLAAVDRRHSGIFEHFARRTREGAQRMERTLELTGLDVDAFIARIIRETDARGGPFVPVSTNLSAQMGEGVRDLDQEMERLAALQVGLASLPITAPLDAFWVSSHFGRRRDPVNNHWATHEGIDLAAQSGSPIYASAPGTVTMAEHNGAYGRIVEIDHGFGIRSRYAHLRSISVERGQVLSHRDVVGKLGSSGRSTGAHVHFEILRDGEPIDPMNFLRAGKHVFKE